MSEINIDDFINVDLRVAKIKEANEVPDADKLVELVLDVGEVGEKRVFAGIKDAYELEDLTSKLVVVVNNLKPRKMRFGISEGMILASGESGKDVFLVCPEKGSKPGDRVK